MSRRRPRREEVQQDRDIAAFLGTLPTDLVAAVKRRHPVKCDYGSRKELLGGNVIADITPARVPRHGSQREG